MEFINSNGKLLIAKQSKKGQVKIEENVVGMVGCPFVCVQSHGKWRWKQLSLVSGSVWKGIRGEITESINKTYLTTKKKYKGWENQLIESQENNSKKQHQIKFLFNNLNDFTKKEYFKQFHNEEIIKQYCKVCNEIGTIIRNECLFGKECTGMCNKCFVSWKEGCPIVKNRFVFGNQMNKDTCPSCNKSQLLECPICYEQKNENQMTKSDNCSHSICCGCFSKSFKSVPIVECPMCRAQFHNTIIKNPGH